MALFVPASMHRKRRRPGGRPDAPDTLYPTLDLHGETAADARLLAAGWLRHHQDAGVRTVRIVTGRGLHSIGPPVLRGEIEALLTALRETLVENFALEPGGGAFRVELRRRRARPAPPTAAPFERHLPAADPALRREAEEALWELGIRPTPELLKAEIRRIRERQGRRGT